MTEVKQKACLICIDGWGINVDASPEGDAILNANTPVMDHLEKEYAYEKLAAHGLSVGLPDGLMGNSEVGHLNIGAGRVVYQDIVRIELALKNGSFATSKNVSAALQNAKNGTGRIHFFGLVSDGGVHSHITHLFRCLDAAKEAGVPHAYVHFIADGRDTQPKSAVQYLKELQEYIKKIGYGTVADITGRYYAMDRDKRWERVKIAYDAYVKSEGEKSSDLLKTVEQRYEQQETDEFLKPIIGDSEGRVKDADTLFFFNFRSDRMREITQVFGISPPPFEANIPKNLHITTMTQYKESYPFPLAFPPQTMDNVLAEWLGKHKVPQSHVAETEKYAHVTFFFNGGCEAQFDGEDRAMVASPKVATYDLKPEMSAKEVGDKVAEEIACGKYPFVMCNFAPPDMVGHTGVYEAAIKGVEATDKAIGVIYEACKKHNYVLFVTSDHGNAEKMISEHGGPHTAHTCNPVPFVMTNKNYKFKQVKDAALCDVAPTILDVMGLPKPVEMTGQSLLAK